MLFGPCGGLAPFPKRYGGRAPAEALFLESYKRAFPDGYSRDNGSIIVADHICYARGDAADARAIEAVQRDAIPQTANLSLRDWADRLDVTILPGMTCEDLRRELVPQYQAVAANDLPTLRAKCAELLGDSFVALKRMTDKQAKVIACIANSANSAGIAPVYPLSEIDSATGSGTSSSVSYCVIGPEFDASCFIESPGTMSTMLSVAIIGDSVWIGGHGNDGRSTAGTVSQALTAVDGCGVLMAFVVLSPARLTTTYRNTTAIQ